MKIYLCMLFLLLTAGQVPAAEHELHLGKFSSGDMTGWKEQNIGMIKNKTTYAISRVNDRLALTAKAKKSASGQIYKLNLEPKEYPILSWSWKIDHIIKSGDEKRKDGDDFAARVYVLFPRGFFTRTRAICYVWANKLPKGMHVTSPFTANVITVAVDSGEDLAGRWINHQRNVYDDYRSFFGEEPPKIGAVAIMTDTDNTSESAAGYYGDITLIRSRKADQKELKQKEQNHRQPPEVKEFFKYTTSGGNLQLKQ